VYVPLLSKDVACVVASACDDEACGAGAAAPRERRRGESRSPAVDDDVDDDAGPFIINEWLLSLLFD
jgi:hypothetical protein